MSASSQTPRFEQDRATSGSPTTRAVAPSAVTPSAESSLRSVARVVLDGEVVVAGDGAAVDAVFLAGTLGRHVTVVADDAGHRARLERETAPHGLTDRLRIRIEEGPDMGGLVPAWVHLSGPIGSQRLTASLEERPVVTVAGGGEWTSGLGWDLPALGYHPLFLGADGLVVWWPERSDRVAPDGARSLVEHALAATAPRGSAAGASGASEDPGGELRVVALAREELHLPAQGLSRSLGPVDTVVLRDRPQVEDAEVEGSSSSRRIRELVLETFVGGGSVSREVEGGLDTSLLPMELLLLERVAASRPSLLVLEYDPALVQVANRIAAALEIPHVVVFHDQDARIGWPTWPLINSARLRLLGPEVDQAAWASRLIMDHRPLADGSVDEWEGLLRCAVREPETPPGRPAGVRVLLVSYYMPPCDSVAMNRLAYWHEQLPRLAAERGLDLSVDAVTATGSVLNDGRYHVVPDRGLDHPTGAAAERLHRQLEGQQINTIGCTWTPYLREWLGSAEPYDVAIISGNPFFYFELGHDLRALGTRVILDFRDPFADNPRIGYSDDQRTFLRVLEAHYVDAADAVLSVNGACLELVSGGREDLERIALPNGYDERVVEHVVADAGPFATEKVSFVYAGTFYRNGDPGRFLAELDPARHELVHVGRAGYEADLFAAEPAGRQLGPRSYEDTIALIRGADVGLIFTSGEPFEQTTKIFDYLGAGVEILIVTAGEPRTGELHRLTAGLPGVHWVRNEAVAIREWLGSFTRSTTPSAEDRSRFSRRAQADRLLDVLVELSAPEAEVRV